MSRLRDEGADVVAAAALAQPLDGVCVEVAHPVEVTLAHDLHHPTEVLLVLLLGHAAAQVLEEVEHLLDGGACLAVHRPLAHHGGGFPAALELVDDHGEAEEAKDAEEAEPREELHHRGRQQRDHPRDEDHDGVDDVDAVAQVVETESKEPQADLEHEYAEEHEVAVAHR